MLGETFSFSVPPCSPWLWWCIGLGIVIAGLALRYIFGFFIG
ncbi:MAG: hypothetical protein ACOZFS_15170 [Thermodesulfobacteriota bacterium]